MLWPRFGFLALLARSHTSIEVPRRERRDEIGAMARAVQVFKETAIEAAALTAERERRQQEQQRRVDEGASLAGAIASAIEQPGAAAREIARNMQEAAQRTGEVSTNIDGVTSAAGDTGTAAHHVLSAAKRLAEQSEALHAEVARFLAALKAA